uniref:Putative secreted protein n=1 Tax=Anopheles triannulatus TaxID=58253 RepID=A0A2M4B4Q5_9DIPT
MTRCRWRKKNQLIFLSLSFISARGAAVEVEVAAADPKKRYKRITLVESWPGSEPSSEEVHHFPSNMMAKHGSTFLIRLELCS